MSNDEKDKLSEKKVRDEKIKKRVRNEGLPNLNVKLVKMIQVVTNNFNYNRQSNFIFGKQKLSILNYGFVEPIVCRKFTVQDDVKQTKSGETWEIINGEHRYLALRDLFEEGKDVFLDTTKTIPLQRGYIPIIDLGDVSRVQAQQLCIALNEIKGKPDPDMLSNNIFQLKEANIDLSALPYTEVELDSFSRMATDKLSVSDLIEDSGFEDDEDDDDDDESDLDFDDDDFDDSDAMKKARGNANLKFFQDLFGLEKFTEEDKTYIYTVFNKFLKENKIIRGEQHNGLIELFKQWEKINGK